MNLPCNALIKKYLLNRFYLDYFHLKEDLYMHIGLLMLGQCMQVLINYYL